MAQIAGRSEWAVSRRKRARLVGKRSARALIVTLGIIAMPGYAQTAGGAAESSGQLEEVTVTAEKREEAQKDVPVPVSVVDPDVLMDTGRIKLLDYATSVPGLLYSDEGAGYAAGVTLRGVNAQNGGTPAVGFLVDGVPVSASLNLSASLIPDLDPSDLARIEVLRGPQGTLYGSSGIGGLINYVTVDPSTAEYSAQARAGTSFTYNAAEPGYDAGAALNAPITETLALRASAYAQDEAGFIDNTISQQKGVNDTKASGGRVAVKWAPADGFSIRGSALYQSTRLGALNHVTIGPGFGSLQNAEVPNASNVIRVNQIYSLIVDARFGNTRITSTTGYNTIDNHNNYDYDYSFGFLDANSESLIGVPNDTSAGIVRTASLVSKATQEVRAETPIGTRLDWLVGGFYTHERSQVEQYTVAAASESGAQLASYGEEDWYTTYTEYAAYTDIDWHATDRLDVQAGGRESFIEESYSELDTGPVSDIFFGAAPYFWPETVGRANAFTYLLTPKWKVSDDLMLYARFASGYRPGGPNAESTIGKVPTYFAPDRTQNYELGAKGDVLGRLLSIDASVYFISWRDIQQTVIVDGSYFASNSGDAKSEGMEFSVDSKPASGLDLAAWVAYTDAAVTAFPDNGASYAEPGERLPFTSRWAGNVSVTQTFPIIGRWMAYASGTDNYIGERYGYFLSNPATVGPSTYPRNRYPAYSQINLSTGVKYDTWKIGLYATNVANKLGLVQGGPGLGIAPDEYVVVRPRTVGMVISGKF